jgi:hypothetical protein
MCRFSHDAAVWACLAALSMAAGELSTAEAAFAAIDAVDKLQYVLRLRGLAGGAATAAAAAGDPLVAAELALYAGQPDEAEAKLLQVGSWSCDYLSSSRITALSVGGAHNPALRLLSWSLATVALARNEVKQPGQGYFLLLLLRGCVQAGLVYRAVKLHVRLHNWQRALDLAVKHKQHLDTVLMYRQR